MPEIAVMPDSLISQVAAGEVVERPASVVKELIENSLDAGASQIDVHAQKGGVAMIRVIDDGKGMAREDALLSIERHATSKLRSKEELETVGTFGFRGEALPSIASVSRFRLSTRQHDGLSGTEIQIEGGKLKDVRDAGDAPGTTVEVRSLFFNLPARRKFLRAESTELSHVEQQVRVHAAAHPRVGFTFRHGDRSVLQLASEQGLEERLSALAGRETFERMVEIKATGEGEGPGVSGWISPAGFGKGTKSLQYVFINGRPVEAAAVNIPVREVYRRLLPPGQHPVLFLYLSIDPAEIDVNVHPAKREVRFRRQRDVQEAISHAFVATLQDAVQGPERGEASSLGRVPKAGLASGEALPDPPEPMSVLPSVGDPPGRVPLAKTERSTIRVGRVEPRELPLQSGLPPRDGEKVEIQAAERFRIVGQIEGGYVVLESDEGLVLMHQRAAHERILFEQAREQIRATGSAANQKLLFPVTIDLSPVDFDLVVRHLPGFQRIGLGIEAFGSNTVKVDAVPAFADGLDPESFLQDLLGRLQEGSTLVTDEQMITWVCRNVVQTTQAMTAAETEALVEDLLECEMPYCDATGRPTLIQYSRQELARKFRREG
ncbi:MAG: DNA mismatch repair endonuclease MutL [Verrucomicrobiota bacterium]